MSDNNYKVLTKKLNIVQHFFLNANETKQTKQPKY